MECPTLKVIGLKQKANGGIRTLDRTLTKRLLYRLSYVGVPAIIPDKI